MTADKNMGTLHTLPGMESYLSLIARLKPDWNSAPSQLHKWLDASVGAVITSTSFGFATLVQSTRLGELQEVVCFGVSDDIAT